MRIGADARTRAHRHGTLESVIYFVRCRARMYWDDSLEFVAEADAGDFIFVPPYLPRQGIDASPDQPPGCVLARSDNETVVVTTLIVGVDTPSAGIWADLISK